MEENLRKENKNPNPNWKKLQEHGLKIGMKKAQEQHAEKMSERIGEMKTHFGDTIAKNLPATEAAIKRQKKEQKDLMTRPRTLSKEEEKKIQKNIFGWERSEEDKEKEEAKIVEKHRKQYQENYLKILANPKSLNYFKLRLKNILKVLSKKGELGTLCPGDYWGQKDTGCSIKIAKKIGQPELRGKPLLDAIVKHYDIDETLKIKKGGRKTKKYRKKRTRKKKKSRKRRRIGNNKKKLKRLQTQYRRFRIAKGDKRFKGTDGLIKWSRPSKSKKKGKKRSRRIYHRKRKKKNRKKRGGRTHCKNDAWCYPPRGDLDRNLWECSVDYSDDDHDEQRWGTCQRRDRDYEGLRQRAHDPGDSDDE